MILCGIVGVFMIIDAYIPHPIISGTSNRVTSGLIIVSSFALALGLASLIYMHVNKIRRQVPGWGYSIVTLTGLVVVAVLGVGWNIVEGTPVYWVYRNMIIPMAMTMFSMLAFFIASAAYKAFRARTIEATVLLAAGIIVMLGQIPVGDMISGGFISQFKDWILNYPSMAVQRAIYLGLALSMVATSLRIIFGIERTYLGGRD